MELTSDKLGCLDKECVHAKSFSCARFFATLWTVACQAPLSIGFSRQEYWSGLPCPSLEDLPNPEIEMQEEKDKLKERLNKKEPEFEELGNFLVAQSVKNLPTMQETQV